MIGTVLGLVVASYLGTLLARWPRGESATFGRSRCDACRRRLAWFELVPLASFLALAGRCRACGAAIPWVYPLLEIGCGVAGAWLFLAGAPALAPLAWLLIALSLFDALHLWLPDKLVALLAVVAIASPGFDAADTLALRLAAGVTGFAALWLIGRAFRMWRGHDGLGGGDPKLFGAIGLWVGPLALPLLLLSACVIGFGDAAWRLLRSRQARNTQLPLGTYLSAATVIIVVARPLLVPA
ncbi:MAG: prepilin peptidase [Novosphingobium sp.]|nr:prepilin peptidase [Novosphingobium sp.]